MKRVFFVATATASLVLGAFSTVAYGADIHRKLIGEFDPMAPGGAAYESSADGLSASEWGGRVDFNVAGLLSTGPEIWTGVYRKEASGEGSVRREDFWPGEKHKADAIRLRWTIGKWQKPSSMRGWYLKTGYSYMRVNSRANRYTEQSGEGDAIPVGGFVSEPDDETDLVQDVRHGMMFGFGNRWAFFRQKVTVTLGASITANFKRDVSVDSKDDLARADYDAFIEDLPASELDPDPLPEASLALGYAW